jgi:hypothetical protein
MSTIQQQSNKIGLENGRVIYQPSRTPSGPDYSVYEQNRLRMRLDPVTIINDPTTSFWKSPDDIPGAIKDNHRHVGWLARGETFDSYGNTMPTWEEPLVKTKEFINAKNNYAIAGQDAPRNWGFSDEWYPKAFEYIAVASKAKKENKTIRHALVEAGIIDSQTYPTLERIDTQIAVEQAETVTHIFRQVSTLETTDMLDISKIFTFVGPGITRHTLGDYRVPYPKHGSVTEVEIEQLDKDMAHVAWSEEFFLKTYEANIRELNLASIPVQMEKSKQTKIAVVIDAISGTPVIDGDWETYTAGDSNNNPYPDLDAIMKLISDVDGNPNTFVSSNSALGAFLRNTFVTGFELGRSGSPFGTLNVSNRVVSGADGVNETGLIWGVDSLFPNGDLSIYDRRAVRLRQGPSNIKDYTDGKTGVTGRIWKDFNLAYNWRSTWTKKLTGVVP